MGRMKPSQKKGNLPCKMTFPFLGKRAFGASMECFIEEVAR